VLFRSDISLENEIYRLVLVISFRIADPDMKAFNITFNVDPDSDESLDMLGPMIAARTVSSLKIDLEQNSRIIITVSRNREYPDSVSTCERISPPSGTVRTDQPSSMDMQHFASIVSGYSKTFSDVAPAFLLCPGMASDMLDAGAVSALLAYEGNTVLGGIIWTEITDTCVEIFGPLVFCDDRDSIISSSLLDGCMGKISRTRTRTILRRQDRLEGYEKYFDYLGSIQTFTLNRETRECPHYYRQLREEASAAVYCDRQFSSFLKKHYDTLCLPRQIREMDFQSHSLRDHSVISVEFSRSRSSAILRPMCAGLDMKANIKAHIELLKRENILNISAETDTGKPEEMMFTSSLMESGFIPKLVIPEAGSGDIVVFSWAGSESRDRDQEN
jgi:hypothetical protein